MRDSSAHEGKALPRGVPARSPLSQLSCAYPQRSHMLSLWVALPVNDTAFQCRPVGWGAGILFCGVDLHLTEA